LPDSPAVMFYPETFLTNKPSLLFIKTLIFTGLALIAFAANSVLCRLALGEKTIDACSFTVIRLLSGAVVLWAILKITRNKNSSPAKGSWWAGLMLFIYAVAFSFAYISLDTGTGALILFASVQITMISLYIISGNRLHITERIGISIAFIGFAYLILPGVSTPSVTGFSLMTIAGMAWGVYTLKGRDSVNPLMDTAYNFLRTIPLVMVLAIAAIGNARCSTEGIVLAALSGAIASGIGYTLCGGTLSRPSRCGPAAGSRNRRLGRCNIRFRSHHSPSDPFRYNDTRRHSSRHLGSTLSGPVEVKQRNITGR
jgi:hypothetical protein